MILKDLEKLITSEMSSSINSSSTNESYFGYSNAKNESERVNKYRSSSSSPKRIASISAKPKKVTFPNESRLEQPDASGLDDSFVSVTTTTSSIIDNKVIKRKIVR